MFDSEVSVWNVVLQYLPFDSVIYRDRYYIADVVIKAILISNIMECSKFTEVCGVALVINIVCSLNGARQKLRIYGKKCYNNAVSIAGV